MAALTYVMALEGVLVADEEDVDLARESPNPTALSLYLPLANAGRLMIATNVERRLFDHWCRMNSMTQHFGVVPLDERTVQRVRSLGESPDLYIDGNSERVAAALRQGVTTLLWSRALYARAGHRPDLAQPQRQWAQVTAEQAAQRAARAKPMFEFDA